jgi:Arc-like DNA binding domain
MRARVGKNQKLTRVAVRLPQDLVEYLSESARQFNHSLNAEILRRLEDSQELDPVLLDTDIDGERAANALRKLVRHKIHRDVSKGFE